jgi:hypothetical protein
MAVAGPFLAGGASQNNRVSVVFSPTVNIPAGALIWLVGGTDVVDTADLTLTDSAGNVWVFQVFVQPPGVPGSMVVAYARLANALPTGGSLTLTSSIRGDWDFNLYYHTGAQGQVFSTDIQFIDTSTTPVARCFGRVGMTLFGTVGVRGPSVDGFTPDASWDADQKGTIPRTNVTIHASGRIADAEDWYTYAPVLGTARRSLIFAGAFL